MERKNIGELWVTFIIAVIVFVFLFIGKSNISCSTLMFFLGIGFILMFVNRSGIKGALPLYMARFPERKMSFYKKCAWSAALAGVIVSAIAGLVLKLPSPIWQPIMFFIFFGEIFYPPLFYSEESDSYKDVSFGELFLLSLAMAFAILCVLAGAYFQHIKM